MSTAGGTGSMLARSEESMALRDQWRTLTRAATFVALLTSPAAFFWFHREQGWGIGWSILAALGLVIAFRGLIDLGFRNIIPWPSLFGTDDARLREEDVLARRRAWSWRWFYRTLLVWPLLILTLIWLFRAVVKGQSVSWVENVTDLFDVAGALLSSPQLWIQVVFVFFLFAANVLIFLGPLMLMGISQIRGFEPGDADWGVRLEDVRGQAEAKDEVRKIINLWQSGEAFVKAGGKRERGILFLGAPGTGKTMLAKAIATGFNSPFVTIPGSGFAQTFIGVDALIVRWLARRARKLARKWGGQCIVFIDEIDAVGMRRSTLGGAAPPTSSPPAISATSPFEDFAFFGPHGALTPSGDLVLETRAWRDKLFDQREQAPPTRYPGWYLRLGGLVNQAFPGMFGGMGQLALNQLLVVMDGIDNPPFWRRFWTNRINSLLDAAYVLPRRIGRVSFRLPQARPLNAQIYFIGATNVPISSLDPALIRPGRLGRHVWFRTPMKKDREDIFDLYLNKVAHDPDLDLAEARDELARITNGYAQPLDSLLLTPTGWKKMGDVEAGDPLVGASGSPTRVLAVHPRGEMDVYRVTFNDKTCIECTADHLWTVEALDPRIVRRTFTLAELMKRGFRWSPKGSPFYLPKLAPAEFGDAEELPIDPYLLGLLLGDGGFTSQTPDFCTADEDNLAAVAELLPAGTVLAQHGPMNWRLSGGSRKGVPRSQPNPLTRELRAMGIWGKTARTKCVPERYKWASTESRLAVLQGLMDTDGTRDYRPGTSPCFDTHSEQLAHDVAFLVRSLGGTARIHAKQAGWRVALDLPEGVVPFRLPRKADDYRASRKPFRKRIVRVEPLGRKVVQCVTVAARDGLYVAGDFTVTHNSPAMIEQVCSLALTYAQHEMRDRFSRADILEAMTTIESGTAVGIDYVPEETRAVAIHEAGHAAAAHVYMKGAESTRLSIRMRAGSLGHHQALEKEERFSRFRSEEMAQLVWTLGAMAAEHAFYGENATGVGGDLWSATTRAAYMVGVSGMAPEQNALNGSYRSYEKRREARRKLGDRFGEIGSQLMNRSSGDVQHNLVASVLADHHKRQLAAEMLGQAYVQAYNFVLANKKGVEKIAETLIERKEVYGNELLELLNEAKLEKPDFDLAKEKAWPTM